MVIRLKPRKNPEGSSSAEAVDATTTNDDSIISNEEVQGLISPMNIEGPSSSSSSPTGGGGGGATTGSDGSSSYEGHHPNGEGGRRRRRLRRREDFRSVLRRIYIWWMTASWSVKLRVIASIVVIVIVNVLSIWAMDHRQSNTISNVDIVWDPYDLAGCDLRKYNETFDDFMTRIRTNVQSDNPKHYFCATDLKMGSKECSCTNPIEPAQVNFDRWHEAFEESKKIADKASKLDPLQLVMIGDSITEHWNGLSVGHPATKFQDIAQVFQELFQMKNGGKINAAALGISGDRASNLLYRIENGGLENLYPNIWWLLIGTNDLSGEFCNVDAIVAANIVVVEKLLELRPNATVVINSLLPRPPFLWTYLEQINERLQCYAASAEAANQVKYFNATDIFRLPDGTLQHLLTDNVHPDAEGSRIWGEAIVNQVLELLET